MRSIAKLKWSVTRPGSGSGVAYAGVDSAWSSDPREETHSPSHSLPDMLPNDMLGTSKGFL